MAACPDALHRRADAGWVCMAVVLPAPRKKAFHSHKIEGAVLQVHPIALTRLGLILQDADGADPRSNGSQWLLAPMLCIGPPDAGGACMAVALPAERRAKKHPDTGRLVYSCHNGFLNVFGAPRGLLRAAVEESQVHTAKTDYHNSATLSVGRYDVAVLTDQLEFEWEQRERLVWAPDDAAALQADL
jgi:hypothetical protein